MLINAYATLASLVAVAQDRLKNEEKGATAVEYGLMVGLIAVVIIGAVVLLGEQLNELFGDVSEKLPAVEGATTGTTGS
ncbi:Flp family type IVb pilin [Blastococcus sp. SYSU DS1021]